MAKTSYVYRVNKYFAGFEIEIKISYKVFFFKSLIQNNENKRTSMYMFRDFILGI